MGDVFLTTGTGVVQGLSGTSPSPFRLPDFHIIGVQKSASTSLHAILRSHPEIYMPKGETPFFEDPEYGRRTLADLAAAFRDAPAGRILGIKRPTDFVRPHCAERMAHDLPGLKLVVMLRNPVNRAVSHYFHLMLMGFIDVGDAASGLEALLRGEGGPADVLANGLYADAFTRWRDFFPAGQIHFILQDDFRTDPQSALANLSGYLGISACHAWPNPDTIVNGGLYAPLPLHIMNRLNRAQYRFGPEPGRLHRRMDIYGQGARIMAAVAQRCLSGFRGNARDNGRIPADLRRRLLDFYLPDMARFEALTGLDIGAWKKP